MVYLQRQRATLGKRNFIEPIKASVYLEAVFGPPASAWKGPIK